MTVIVTILLVAALGAPGPPALGAPEAPRAEVVFITADGLADLQGQTVSAARDAAIENALRQAVEQACGVHLTSESQVRNFQLVGDAVLARSRGYVKTYQVLSERHQEGAYHVTIQADVQLASIEDYLNYSTIVADFEGTDRGTAETVADIFTTAFGGSARYVVLERSPVRLATAAAIIPAIELLGEEGARKAAKQLGARMLVVGSLAYRAGQVTLTARMLDLSTGKVVPSGTAMVYGEDANLLYLAGQLANRVHHNLTGIWLQGLSADQAQQTPQERLHALQTIDPTLMLTGSTAKFKVHLTTDRGPSPTYRPGETMTLKVTMDQDCYVTIYNIDSQGRVTLLFPNRFQTENHLKAGKAYLIPPPEASWELRVEGEPGTEAIQAIATLEPLDLCTQDAFAKSAFPTLSGDAGDFMSKGIVPTLTARAKDEWTTAVVKFYLAPPG
jgi:hypothetical protein